MPAFAQTTVARLAADLEVLRQQGFRLAVIDTPPAITMAIQSVIQVAELIVIPTRPSPHDLRAVGATVDLCDRAGKPLIFVVNARDAQGQDHLRGRGRAVAARHRRSGHAPPPHRFRRLDDRRPHGDGSRSQGPSRPARSSSCGTISPTGSKRISAAPSSPRPAARCRTASLRARRPASAAAWSASEEGGDDQRRTEALRLSLLRPARPQGRGQAGDASAGLRPASAASRGSRLERHGPGPAAASRSCEDDLPEHVPSSIAALTPGRPSWPPRRAKRSRSPRSVAQQRAIAESYPPEAEAEEEVEAELAPEPAPIEPQVARPRAHVVPLPKRPAPRRSRRRAARPPSPCASTPSAICACGSPRAVTGRRRSRSSPGRSTLCSRPFPNSKPWPSGPRPPRPGEAELNQRKGQRHEQDRLQDRRFDRHRRDDDDRVAAALRPRCAASARSGPTAATDRRPRQLYDQASRALQQGNLAEAPSTLMEQAVAAEPARRRLPDAARRRLSEERPLQFRPRHLCRRGRARSVQRARQPQRRPDPDRAGPPGRRGRHARRYRRTARRPPISASPMRWPASRRAVELLEPAARSPMATPRTRQNLALAYAFAGDWRARPRDRRAGHLARRPRRAHGAMGRARPARRRRRPRSPPCSASRRARMPASRSGSRSAPAAPVVPGADADPGRRGAGPVARRVRARRARHARRRGRRRRRAPGRGAGLLGRAETFRPRRSPRRRARAPAPRARAAPQSASARSRARSAPAAPVEQLADDAATSAEVAAAGSAGPAACAGARSGLRRAARPGRARRAAARAPRRLYPRRRVSAAAARRSSAPARRSAPATRRSSSSSAPSAPRPMPSAPGQQRRSATASPSRRPLTTTINHQRPHVAPGLGLGLRLEPPTRSACAARSAARAASASSAAPPATPRSAGPPATPIRGSATSEPSDLPGPSGPL